ncbi:MAG: hypothetical protein IJR57_02505 [Ruminococcus sp.]|nr:hypothetical protein [Ruminococcus sp.]
MKTTRHSLLAKGLMVLLSLLVLIFAFTYTWFTDPDQPVTASGLSLSVRSPSTDFYYAVGFSTSQTGYNYFHTEFTNEVQQDLDLEKLVIYAPPSDPVYGNSIYHNEEVNLLHDYTPVDITGDGVTLVRPAMNYGNWDVNTTSDNFSTAEPNVQYISFDLIFRSNVPGTTIKLDSGSFAKGNCENYAGDGNLTNPNVIRVTTQGGTQATENASNFNKDDEKSGTTKYGQFSRDAIVGAVRVAFLEYEDQSSLPASKVVNEDQTSFEDAPKLLWIPRPDLYLDNGNHDTSSESLTFDQSTTGWTLMTNVTELQNLVSKAQINHAYDTYKHQYYNIAEVAAAKAAGETPPEKDIVTSEGAIASQINSSAPANTNKVTFNQQQDIVTLSSFDDTDSDGVPDDGYYYGKVRIRIWIEGTDSESRRALAGGKFSVGFAITG